LKFRGQTVEKRIAIRVDVSPEPGFFPSGQWLAPVSFVVIKQTITPGKHREILKMMRIQPVSYK